MKQIHPVEGFEIREATEEDLNDVFNCIKALAEYEKMSDVVSGTEEDLKKYLFGDKKVAEVVLGYYQNEVVGFALFFHNFSTFLGKPGIYLEDLFVYEKYRGKGFGKKLLTYLAKLAMERDCGRLEWVVLDWNEPSINFYNSLGAKTMNEWLINRVSGHSLEKLSQMY